METDSGKTVSVWLDTAEMPNFPPLEKDISTEVCVVGGGISGVTTAALLALEGRRVVLIDDGPIGGGETGRTTAHISNALDDRYFELERLHGDKGSRLAAESHTAAINKIEQLARQHGIDCDFQRLDGWLYEQEGGDPKNIQREYEAARRAGLPVEISPRAPAPFNTGQALKFPGQAQFHPLKYLKGLVQVIGANGGQIFTNTRAEDIKGGKQNGSVKTGSGATITAGHIVVATNTPVNDRVVMHTKQAPYRTYVIGVEIPAGAFEAILLWDDADPYHYVRLQKGKAATEQNDLLIVGGEDHKTGQFEAGSAPFGSLEKWTRERFPQAGDVRFRWSGQVMEPVDKIAYIGRNPVDEENVYIITGDSGNGITHGTIGGILITDLIQGRSNPWESLYDPRRKVHSATAGLEFVRENANVAAQYRDFLQRGEVSSVEEIKPGAGAVIRRGLKLMAAYRDETGELHERSAVCPHLGCVVRWNHVEKTWDCPCHGSRFSAAGKVVNGPSLGDLQEPG